MNVTSNQRQQGKIMTLAEQKSMLRPSVAISEQMWTGNEKIIVAIDCGTTQSQRAANP
jgi:hypothetical protein